jgi:hypothetical protein
VRQFAARRDDNERPIIDALEAVGASVQPLSIKGVPDLLVGFLGTNYLLEVKQPGRGLTTDQLEWRNEWKGPPPTVVNTPADALWAIGATNSSDGDR